MPPPPKKYASMLGSYCVLTTDDLCGEPLTWGWPITRRLGEAAFKKLRASLPVICLSVGRWAVVGEFLTRETAERKYGPVTRIERGPKGGRKSITFGTTTFNTRHGGTRLLLPEEGGPVR